MDTNIKYLVDNNCNIWNKDAYNYYLKQAEGQPKEVILTFEEWLNEIKDGEDLLGDLGRVYGAQWRNWKGSEQNEYTVEDHERPFYMDQISSLIRGLIKTPMSTQHIVTAWNPAELDNMALPPCHYGFQIVVRPLSLIERYNIHTKDSYYIHMMMRDHSEEKCHSELDSKNIPKYGFELHFKMRSVDTFLGLPYNIASYALLALILEKITGYKALAIQGDLKKVHLYDNSIDGVKQQLSRSKYKYNAPRLITETNDEYPWNQKDLNDIINSLTNKSFELRDYESYPIIKVEMLERK